MLFLLRIRLTAGNTFTINPINQTSRLINKLGYTLPFTTFESEGSTSSLVRCLVCALSFLILSDSCAFILTEAILMIKSWLQCDERYLG
jgi:hypothetical protein